MNNKMADDYMDGLVKEIKSLQAENDRLRVIEEKASAVVKTYRKWGNDALSFELDELEDALKGGADNES